MGCWESKSRLLQAENSRFQTQSLPPGSSAPSNERLLRFEAEYEVLGQLFQNSHKNVKKIVHKASGKVLCMRVFKRDCVPEKTAEKDHTRFLKQIEILLNLDHENIIKVIDSFNDGFSSYMITEFCNGGELFDKVVTRLFLQERQAADIMSQLLSAVGYCHKRGIAHRDIKPENILFESEGPESIIKLTDFKYAKILKPSTPMKRKLGGVFYLAPEVIKGSYTEKCDIWACGVILYIILCGYPPFSGNTDEKIEEKILQGEISFKGNEWRDVSKEAKDFIQRLMEYDYEKRPSAEEALKNDWFQLHSRNQNSSSEIVIPEVSKKTPTIEVKRAIYEFLSINQGLREDNRKLREIFESFDKDKDYHLPWEEMVKSFDLFKKMHTDKIGWIDSLLDSLVDDIFNYNEILMLIYNKRTAVSKESLERALHALNKSEKAAITVGDLLSEFKKEQLDNDEWTKIVLELQKKPKNEEILLKDLKETITKILEN